MSVLSEAKPAHTQAELAKRLGIARETVSRALANHPAIAPDLRQRVLEGAREHRYRPNSAARSMKSRRFNQIGVLLRNAPDRPRHNLATFELVLGINLALEEAGYSAVLVRLGDLGEDGDPLGRVFEEHVLDGMIVIDNLPEAVHERVSQLTPLTVCLETNHWEPRNCIRRDEEAAGRTVAHELAHLGYRRLVWLQPDVRKPAHFSESERWRGVSETATSLGLDVMRLSLDEWSLDDAQQQRLIDSIQPTTAVVGYDIGVTRWLAYRCFNWNRRPGHDFGLACCDDINELRYLWPELSRVGFDRYELGRQAAAMMLDRLEDRHVTSVRVACPWIAGQTALPVNTSPA